MKLKVWGVFGIFAASLGLSACASSGPACATYGAKYDKPKITSKKIEKRRANKETRLF